MDRAFSFPFGVFLYIFFLVTELVYCQNNTFYTGKSQYQHKCQIKSKLKKIELATSFRQSLICV